MSSSGSLGTTHSISLQQVERWLAGADDESERGEQESEAENVVGEGLVVEGPPLHYLVRLFIPTLSYQWSVTCTGQTCRCWFHGPTATLSISSTKLCSND
jgi:hypothetical protein